ncbi:HNH endonuclease [Verminephrobacter eiseniae]|nr:HNH endonuclease [Verminephrobacter eiseniae]MCW5292102.1 HNH endonuclease [Verminephrobacter eiseniae]MCW8184824.1 HNH endonuclease [Verminephrobacter eiseniae]MCW8222562.1 HNH endonuclease [Verminephrobacter eiseniae]
MGTCSAVAHNTRRTTGLLEWEVNPMSIEQTSKSMSRPAIPEPLKRAILVEAGHRCAIPTCRTTTTEIAHIVPWAETHEHTFENLIALCPNCHTRFDQKREIDRLSIKMYKHNLGILNHRYGEFERRLFAHLAVSHQRIFVVGAGGDLLVANAVKDGFFEDKHVAGGDFFVIHVGGQESCRFPLKFTYWVTDTGVEFIRRYAEGVSIDAQ